MTLGGLWQLRGAKDSRKNIGAARDPLRNSRKRGYSTRQATAHGGGNMFQRTRRTAIFLAAISLLSVTLPSFSAPPAAAATPIAWLSCTACPESPEVTTGVNSVTMGIANRRESDKQPISIHGASGMLPAATKYTVTLDYDFYTWDSYNASGDVGTGYYDSFSVSLTTKPYYELERSDPVGQNQLVGALGHIWGGDKYGDGVLERSTGTKTLEFRGDPSRVNFLNVVLDTATQPASDNLHPSWGRIRNIVVVSNTADGVEAAAPPATISRYMRTTDPTVLQNLGAAAGRDAADRFGTQDEVVILFFGAPHQFPDGTFGATCYTGPDCTTSQIAAGAKAFALGYFIGAGLDVSSQLRLALGTSNFGGLVNRAHGEAWARMVNDVGAYLERSLVGTQVDVAGANDMELDWNTPAATRAWVDGYSALTDFYFLYNFGDAAGCPSDRTPSGDDCGTPTHPEWTVEDVYHISWGAGPSLPLPQIYRNDGTNARQWYRLSLYAADRHGFPMRMSGSLTQHQACLEVSCDPSIDNTPSQGWAQLFTAFNTNDPRTAQRLPWSTDIRFSNSP